MKSLDKNINLFSHKNLFKVYFLIFVLILIYLFFSCQESRTADTIYNDLQLPNDVVEHTDIYEDIFSDTTLMNTYKDEPFIQFESKLLDMDSPVYTLNLYNNSIISGKDDGLYILSGENSIKLDHFGDSKVTGLFTLGNKLAVIGESWVKIGDTQNISTEMDFLEEIKFFAKDGDSRLIIGFDENRYELFDNNRFTKGKFDFTFNIKGMCASTNYYYFLTDNGIYRNTKDLKEEKMVIEGKFSSIRCNEGDVLTAGSEDGFIIYENNELRRITEGDGIPYLKVKSAYLTDRGILATSDKGLMWKRGDGHWEYFHSRYYIPDWDVNDLTFDSEGNLVVATAKGIGIIYPESMTLAQKEVILYNGMKERHNRMGFYSPCTLQKSGDLSSAITRDDDNDGQWSGMHLATMCFKYVVTKDETVLNDARETLNALLLLETVTGKDGFFARSVVDPKLCPEKEQGEGEWHLSTDGKWCFKGDTSSDEYVGHIFGLSIYYDYCASDEEKKEISKVHSNLQRHIVLNGYQILDLDGRVTTHGHFDPDWMKNIGIFGDAGLNSAMILGGLRFAYHITGDKFFEEHFYKLARDERYFDYVRRIEDINTAVQINHDSEEMSFLALFTLLRLETDTKFKKYWYEGLENIYLTQIREKNPEFNMIYALFNPDKNYHLEDSIKTLKEFYTHGIEWKVYNSHRADYTLDPRSDRFGRAQSLEVFPYNQKRVIRWAENPFVLDEEGEGYGEQFLTPFLLPYWMGRFIGVIK